MRNLKKTLVAIGAVALTSSALALPTIIISDGVASTSLTSAIGDVTYNNPSFDGAWSVVVTTGLTKTTLGTPTSPQFDLNIQATSISQTPTHSLVITFSENGFALSPASFFAATTGHIVSGTGQPVSYSTYYDAGNVTGAMTTLLTSSGSLPGPDFTSSQSGSIGSLALYSLTQVVTINGNPAGTQGATYSLDASLVGVPDGGATVMLLGAALSGLALLRRKLA